MPLETTTTRLQQITSKGGTSAQGPWTRYDFTLDGFRRPFSTFNKDLVDMSMQGKMVQVSYTEKPASFTNEAGQTIDYTLYNLENIQALEDANAATLDEELAPVAQQQAVQTVVNRTNGETPSSPSDALKQADIRRAVALKAAVEFANGKIAAGEEQNEANILEYTNNFQAILESR